MMDLYTFDFKGRNSKEFGVKLAAAPTIVKPKMRHNTITVDGKAGAVYEELGYEVYDRTLEINIKNKNRLEEIQNWLFGSGELICFNESGKIYDANILEDIQYKRNGRFLNASVPFTVQPYKRAVNNQAFEIISGEIVINTGNVRAAPNIQITGTGNVILLVNNREVCVLEFGTVQRTLEIDSGKQDCFCNGSLANRSMKGKFPYLEPGENIISVYGDISKIEIKKGEKWI